MKLTRALLGAGVLVLSGAVAASEIDGKSDKKPRASSISTPIGSQKASKPVAATSTPLSSAQTLASSSSDVGDGLIPRQPVPKTPTFKLREPERATGRLVIKFVDSMRARADGAGGLLSLSAQPLDDVNAVLQGHNARLSRGFNKTDAELAMLETRAAAISGKAQPDLAGMMYVDTHARNLEPLAQALNELPNVEWVIFDIDKRPWQECGEDGGDCISISGPCCTDEACCDAVSDLDPFCCPEEGDPGEWDEVCVAWANLICNVPPADRCLSAFNGSCFEPHPTEGCQNEECCNIVCDIDAFCCLADWDANCVDIAFNFCLEPSPVGDTPDYESLQGYLNPHPYAFFSLDGTMATSWLPPSLSDPALAEFPGYSGEGWNIEDPGEPYMDENGNGIWDEGEDFFDLFPFNGEYDPPDPYGGLRGLAQELLEVYGVDGTGLGNITDGTSAKVAVIEWAIYADHEDFIRDDDEEGVGSGIIVEPGQTMIMIPAITAPDHATACMSIINAQDNGLGVTGIVPEAEAYFFPLTSIEEGPRELTAWASALGTLGYGDVISCSYGGGGNLNTNQDTWTLIRLASDLGISVSIAAGNDCSDMSEEDNLGNSGGTVVGAGSPGRPNYRLAFSNYYTDPAASPDTNGNMVHIQAWGDAVVSAGYGDLLMLPSDDEPDGDPRRSYSNQFGGTSAAAPQIAGLICALQGFCRQFYGTPLGTDTIRSALSSGGVPQSIGTIRFSGGFDPASPFCGLDTDLDLGPYSIGVYPTPAGGFSSATSSLLNQFGLGFDDAPLIDALEVLRGTLLNGNVFSIKGSDSAYLVVQSEFTKHGTTVPIPPGSVNGAVISRARYLGGGDITDILVTGHSNLDTITTMTITTELRPTDEFVILFLEMFDWNTMTWSFSTINTIQGDPSADMSIDHELTLPGRFVDPDTDDVLMRFWTLGFGGNITGHFHTMRYNLINLQITGGP